MTGIADILCIRRLFEVSVEIPWIFWFGGFRCSHDSRRLSQRRRSKQADRVGARWVGGLSRDATRKHLGAFGRWVELSGSRRCVFVERRYRSEERRRGKEGRA